MTGLGTEGLVVVLMTTFIAAVALLFIVALVAMIDRLEKKVGELEAQRAVTNQTLQEAKEMTRDLEKKVMELAQSLGVSGWSFSRRVSKGDWP